MKKLVEDIGFSPETPGNHHLYTNYCNELECHKSKKCHKSFLKVQTSVNRVVRWRGFVRVAVVPAVQLSPVNSLIQSIQSNLVLGSNGLCIVQSDFESHLFKLYMIQEVAESHTGDEKSHNP